MSRPIEARPPVVQARALETRHKILQQAEVAFAEHGFHDTTVTAHILTPAGVSVGSFYHQFSNKLELLLAVLDERSSRRQTISALMVAPERTSLDDVVRVTLHALLDDLEANPAPWWLPYRERLNPDPAVRAVIAAGWNGWDVLITDIITLWYPGSSNVDEAARLVVNSLRGFMLDYLLAATDGRARMRAVDLEATVGYCVGGVERVTGAAALERS